MNDTPTPTETKSLFSRERIISLISIPVLILFFISNISHIISRADFVTGILVILLANILVELHFIKIRLSNK